MFYEEGDLDRKHFVPKDSYEEKPYKLEQVKIKFEFDRDANESIWKIWIRGINSMWFRADQCFIHSELECIEYCQWMKQKRDERESARGILRSQALAKLTKAEQEALEFPS